MGTSLVAHFSLEQLSKTRLNQETCVSFINICLYIIEKFIYIYKKKPTLLILQYKVLFFVAMKINVPRRMHIITQRLVD